MRLLEWFRANGLLSGWLAAVSVVLFVASLVLMPLLIIRMRPDYFLTRRPSSPSSTGRQRAMRFTVHALKNVLGFVLLLAGMVMLVTPGPGVITMLVGITLMEFPGKRRLELAIVRQRHVFRAINWTRAKAKRPLLILPEP